MPVGQVTCTEMFIEVLHKLRAVVGQDVLEREGEEEGGEVEEVLGCLARLRVAQAREKREAKSVNVMMYRRFPSMKRLTVSRATQWPG